MKKRILSLFLALLMVSGLALPALADVFALVETSPDPEQKQAAESAPPMTAQTEDGLVVEVALGEDVTNIPEGSHVDVAPLSEVESEEYEKLGAAVLNGKVAQSRFVDITILDPEGQSVEPNGKVKVSLNAPDAAPEGSTMHVVHFKDPAASAPSEVEQNDLNAELPIEEKAEPQPEPKKGLLSKSGLRAESITLDKEENGIASLVRGDAVSDGVTIPSDDPVVTDGEEQLSEEENEFIIEEITDYQVTEEGTILFETYSFSVFGIIYTVDFHWNVEGQSFEYSIPGGGFISLTELLTILQVADDIPAFVAEIENVVFSNPELVWIGKIDEETTVGSIKSVNELNCQYSEELSPEQIEEIDAQVVNSGDWALISLVPFETEETLTVTMKDGQGWTINVTDGAHDAVLNPDGTVQTIANPSSTTIDMFDYWLNNETAVARRGWPGYTGSTGYETNFYNYFNGYANPTGNNAGINANHKLKFVPGMSGQVQDYSAVDGHSYGNSQDGRVDGINSWNGTSNNGTVLSGQPTQGIVYGALDENGYPRLDLGGNSSENNESLDYLFDPAVNHNGKRSYPRVNQLLYVDSEGYYTYDSMDYSATLNKSNNEFEVKEQPTTGTGNGIPGFWPMGSRNYWFGLHLHTDFSMPQNGQVLNPKGIYKDMEFQFSGDDDAWCYIDGILVADGGGIHNRTELDINFKTGEVKVIGGRYTDVSNPNMTVISTRTIYDIFAEAHENGLIDDETWNSYEWNDATNPTTFKSGTQHTFDFFYLERGGSESNMYIHYNLISTTDLSAHKSYHNTNRLYRDQFKFEIIGFDNDTYDGEFKYAILPGNPIDDGTGLTGQENGAGTVASPKKAHYDDFPGNTIAGDGYTSLIVGVSEDGNVNFGNIELSESEEGKEYKYMVREIVPDDAENPDGVTWAEADDETKLEGGFVKDGITYDGTVYYFIGKVVETEPNSQKYELKKTRYTDSTYSVIDTKTKFFNFLNGYVNPVGIKVVKRSNSGVVLEGAEFSLTRAMQDGEKWVTRKYTHNGELLDSPSKIKTTDEHGELLFTGLSEGHYILEETKAPEGYQKNDIYRWLLTLTKIDTQDEILIESTLRLLDNDGGVLSGEPITLNPDNNFVINYNILNGKIPRTLDVEKKWYKEDGTTEITPTGTATNTVITADVWRRATVETIVEHPKVKIFAKLDNANEYILQWEGEVENGTDVVYSMAVNGTGYPISQTTSSGDNPEQLDDQNITYNNGINKPSGHVYALRHVTHDINLYAEFDNTKANNLGIGFFLVSKTDPRTTSTTENRDEVYKTNVTLNSENNWKVSYTSSELNEQGIDWEYYLKNITETGDNGFELVDTPVITTSEGKISIAIKNIQKPGALKIKKIVSIIDKTGEHSATTDEYGLVDHEYIFEIAIPAVVDEPAASEPVSGDSVPAETTPAETPAPTVVKYVKINVHQGVATQFKVADTLDGLDSATWSNTSEGWALVTGLAEGDYIVRETDDRYGLYLSAITRGDNSTSPVDMGNSSVTLHVTANDIEANNSNAQGTFKNSYVPNTDQDKITLDIVKTFNGLDLATEVPENFKLVVSYAVGSERHHFYLISEAINHEQNTSALVYKYDENNQDVIVEGETVKIVETRSEDGFTLSWHVTGIKREASDFKIHEVNYNNVSSYVFDSATLNGDDITATAGEDHSMTVIAPAADLSDVTNDRTITSDSHDNTKFKLEENDVLLIKLTGHGKDPNCTLIVSEHSLNLAARNAIEKDWPNNFHDLKIYFSIEEHQNGFTYYGKSVTFGIDAEGKRTVSCTTNVSALEKVFAVEWDSETFPNNATLTNSYVKKTVTLELRKLDNNDMNSTTSLTGAEFTLRKLNPDSTGTTIGGDTALIKTSVFDSDKSVYRITAIPDGYYEIEETHTPDGYILTGSGKFYIKVVNGFVTRIDKCDTNDPETDIDETKVKNWPDHSGEDNIIFVSNTPAVQDNPDTPQNEAADAIFLFKVGNEPGAELPHTGSTTARTLSIIGTTALMIAGAGYMLATHKKKEY